MIHEFENIDMLVECGIVSPEERRLFETELTTLDDHRARVDVMKRERFQFFAIYKRTPKKSSLSTCRNCGAPIKVHHGTNACHYCGVVR